MTRGVGGSPLSTSLPGTWELLSRIDVTSGGEQRVEPALGSHPIAWLIYDRAGHFAAQFMGRDRSAALAGSVPGAGANNSRAQGGYDAYFGTYEIDEAAGAVVQRLLGALTQENVGQTFRREVCVVGDQMTIVLGTTAADGEAIVRTLIWRRIG